MSRSRKKTPIFKDNGGMKKIANRKIRRTNGYDEDESIESARAHYKRKFPQYDICDYMFYEPDKEDWIEGWLEHHPKATEKEANRAYMKYYERK